MNSNKFLIINADDFGMSHEFNMAISELLKNGNISSTSIMPNGIAYKEALELINKYSLHNVGLHLTLTRDSFTSTSPILYSSITHGKTIENIDGYLYNNPLHLKSIADENELKKEIIAQFNRVISDNINITHIDNHMYSLIPRMGYKGYKTIFSALKEIDIKSKIGIRIASNYYVSDQFNYIWSGRKLYPYIWYKMKSLNLKGPNYSFAFPYYAQTCKSIKEKQTVLHHFLSNLKPGTTELHFHPCIYSENLKSYNPYWENRIHEYEILQSISAKMLYSKYGIVLTSYSQI